VTLTLDNACTAPVALTPSVIRSLMSISKPPADTGSIAPVADTFASVNLLLM